ncbi:MAG: hypothetical protein J7L45_01800 [Candidatus Aenigmarchaeota archaeon]|nr:hypothetical protein [Candidatus Aenigmarchaeota archaeon]
MTDILIFGDSIVFGKWDELGGWAHRLKMFLEKKHLEKFRRSEETVNNTYFNRVYLLGIDGNKTSELLERFELETTYRTEREKYNRLCYWS